MRGRCLLYAERRFNSNSIFLLNTVAIHNDSLGRYDIFGWGLLIFCSNRQLDGMISWFGDAVNFGRK
jgi:hypothetical protein